MSQIPRRTRRGQNRTTAASRRRRVQPETVVTMEADLDELMPRRRLRDSGENRGPNTNDNRLQNDSDERLQNSGDEHQPIDVENVPDTPTCIDLTEADDNDEFVDLTCPSVTLDSPIVILSSTSERRSTRSGVNSTFDLIDESQDDDLPVFDISRAGENGGEDPTASNTGTTPDGPSVGASPVATPGRAISCPVCMDNFREISRSSRTLMSTTCGHIFCSLCINNAIDVQHKCPSCRKKLTKKQIHPLYL